MGRAVRPLHSICSFLQGESTTPNEHLSSLHRSVGLRDVWHSPQCVHSDMGGRCYIAGRDTLGKYPKTLCGTLGRVRRGCDDLNRGPLHYPWMERDLQTLLDQRKRNGETGYRWHLRIRPPSPIHWFHLNHIGFNRYLGYHSLTYYVADPRAFILPASQERGEGNGERIWKSVHRVQKNDIHVHTEIEMKNLNLKVRKCGYA